MALTRCGRGLWCPGVRLLSWQHQGRLRQLSWSAPPPSGGHCPCWDPITWLALFLRGRDMGMSEAMLRCPVPRSVSWSREPIFMMSGPCLSFDLGWQCLAPGPGSLVCQRSGLWCWRVLPVEQSLWLCHLTLCWASMLRRLLRVLTACLIGARCFGVEDASCLGPVVCPTGIWLGLGPKSGNED